MEEDEVFELFVDRSKSDELLWGSFAQDEGQYLRRRVHWEAFLACQYFFAIGNPGTEATNMRMMVTLLRSGLWLCN